MIHQPASSFYEAQAGEFILEAEELLKLRETLTKVMYKERATLYGLYPKIWKGMFLCQQQKPKLMASLIL
ncbi:ATP-dependent Clp protease proteolytic subunit [Platanthera guangdongensis]|uniref:ATP-dependent Clp protease proteolytic subunit n=1 Tax=Platanthera guangdongensis TaxID=2320717 RepID=A0ABR2MZJ9_9ASPA